MKTYLNFKIIGLVLIIFGAFGCQKTEVTPVISPDGYPMVTYTTDFTGSEVNEGDTITYTITMDKPIDMDLIFGVKFDTLQTKMTASSEDIIVEGGVMAAYSKETTLNIIVPVDDIPENDETLRMEVGVFDIGTRYLLNPKTVNPKLAVTAKNKNLETALTVIFGWDTGDDFDLYIVDEAMTALFGGYDAATGSNPEVTTGFTNESPDGTYYLEFDPYNVAASSVNVELAFGYPDGSSEFVSGTIDMNNLDGFEAGGIGYRFVKIVKTGSTYTVTSLL